MHNQVVDRKRVCQVFFFLHWVMEPFLRTAKISAAPYHTGKVAGCLK
jgi:hypothetical protein